MIADDSDAIRLVLTDILSIGEHEIVSELLMVQKQLIFTKKVILKYFC